MKRLTFLFALFLCLCVFAGASETEAEEGDLILPSLADIGFPDAPDADKPRVIKANEFEGPDTGASGAERVGTVRGGNVPSTLCIGKDYKREGRVPNIANTFPRGKI